MKVRVETRASAGPQPSQGTLGDRINALLSAAGMNFANLGSTSQAAVCCCCGSVLRWSLI